MHPLVGQIRNGCIDQAGCRGYGSPVQGARVSLGAEDQVDGRYMNRYVIAQILPVRKEGDGAEGETEVSVRQVLRWRYRVCIMGSDAAVPVTNCRLSVRANQMSALIAETRAFHPSIRDSQVSPTPGRIF